LKQLTFITFILLNINLVGQSLDLRLLKSLNAKEMPQWDKGMKVVTFSPYVVMPSAIAATWLHGYLKDDKVMMRNGYKSAITVGFAVGLASGLKYLVNRTRPYKEYPNDITRRDFNNGPYSFPSGHTTVAFASATALSLSYKKWYVTAPAFVYAGFVSYSRMRLGVHYPSDVLGGIVIGVGSGFLTWFLDKRINGQ
jgi:membrane-associated phospholipid phosphatase